MDVRFSKHLGLRRDSQSFPFPGIGSLNLGLCGSTTLLMWPVDATINGGSCMQEASMMFDGLSNVQATAFAEKHIKFCKLKD